MKTLLVVLVFILSLAASSPVAAETEIQRYRFSREYAQLHWSSREGCVATSLSLFGRDARARESAGKPDVRVLAVLLYSQYDFCRGEQLRWALGFTSEPELLQTTPTRATLRTTFQVCDYRPDDSPAECYAVPVNVRWRGANEAHRSHQVFQNKEPGYRFTYRSHGTYREAEVTGSTELPTGSISVSDAYAIVGTDKIGELIIYRQ